MDPERIARIDLVFDLIRHVFGFAKFFDESLPEDHHDNFYMEREWRVMDFVPFDLGDVQAVYVAPGYQSRVQSEFSGLKIKELT